MLRLPFFFSSHHGISDSFYERFIRSRINVQDAVKDWDPLLNRSSINQRGTAIARMMMASISARTATTTTTARRSFMLFQRAWSTSAVTVEAAAAAIAALREEASCLGSNGPKNIGSVDASVTETAKSSLAKEASVSQATINSNSNSNNSSSNSVMIHRHGAGDSIVTLNVGGVEFWTLRSTIQTSPILESIVTKAEANPDELMTSTGAIFVDRDPTHFPTILEYLRIRAENMQQQQLQESISSSSTATVNAQLTPSTTTNTKAILSSRIKGAALQLSTAVPNVVGLKATVIASSLDPTSAAAGAAGAVRILDYSSIPLPQDHKTMSALYMEATYHGIPELQQALTEHSFWARVRSLFGVVQKSSSNINPFNAAAATKAFTVLRASLLALGGVVGTMTVTKSSSSSSDNGDSMVSRLLHWVGMLHGGEEEDEAEAGEEGEGEAEVELL